MNCEYIDLGIIDYRECYFLQKELHKKRHAGSIPDMLLLCEHPTVITMGRSASFENILIDKKYLNDKCIEIIEVDRGGDVSMHMPGQLVVYPIFDLKLVGCNLHFFLRKLEAVILLLLQKYGVCGRCIPGSTGVWVENKKVGSIGIGVGKWISFHGLSININNDLAPFSFIRPCGMRSELITSLAAVVGRHLCMHGVKDNLINSFKEVFALNTCDKDLAQYRDLQRVKSLDSYAGSR